MAGPLDPQYTALVDTSGDIAAITPDGELNVTIDALELPQGSTTAGQSGVLVQGAVTTTFVVPSTGTTSPLSLTTGGQLRVCASPSAQTPAQSANSPNTVAFGDPQLTFGLSPAVVTNYLYGGAFSGTTNAAKLGFSPARMSTVFKTVSVAATATGNTAVWTPASGNKFRLLGFQVTAQGLSATATGVVTVSFQDGSTPLGFGTYDVDVPAVAGIVSGVNAISCGWVPMGEFGILSAAANNVLNFNISAAGTGTTGAYRINVCGTEE